MTEAEILQELLRAAHRNDPGKTTEEWRQALGLGRDRIAKVLREANRRGMLVVGRRENMTLNGARGWVPVYRVVKGKKP